MDTETTLLMKRFKSANTDEAKRKRIVGLKKINTQKVKKKVCNCGKTIHRNGMRYELWKGKKCCSEQCEKEAHRRALIKRMATVEGKKIMNKIAMKACDFWLYKYRPVGV